MSSSAALESTYAFALNELFGENKIDKFELAKVGQAKMCIRDSRWRALTTHHHITAHCRKT